MAICPPDKTLTRRPVADRPTLEKRSRAKGVSRTVVNFWLDAGLLVLLLVILWTTAVVRLVFPAGPDAARWILWGGTFDDWLTLQFVSICLFGLGVLVHLMLHWSWICGVVSTRLLPGGNKHPPDDGVRTLYGVGLLILLLHVLGIGIAAATLMIQAT
jgi:hypothetical protein